MRSGLAATLLLSAALTGCDLPGGDPSPDGAIDDLIRELMEKRHFPEVTEALEDVEHGVRADDVETDGDTTTVTLHWTWSVTEATPWEYDTEVVLTLDGETWEPVLEPTLIEPSLVEGEVLGTTTLHARRGDILGAGDAPLVTNRPVVRFGIDKTKVGAGRAADSARRLAQLLDIDPAVYAERVTKAGPKAFVEALVMRAEDAEDVETAGIKGAVGFGTELPLAPTREFAAPLLGSVGEATAEIVKESGGRIQAGDRVGLSGLQARYDEQLAGADGVQVEAIAPDGAERVLVEIAEVNGEPLRTTLDQASQRTAEAILADVGPAAALVAIQPSTGRILAAASGPGSNGYNTATFGQYAPGSTFKAVTALALLRSGLTPDSQVECPPTTTVDGKQFKNYDDYPSSSLGRIPLREAIAQSCNTALINQRDRLDATTLEQAAAALGLGVDHDLGFPAYFGQAEPSESETGRAADLIGQGSVLASPMAMATVMASVVRGQAVLPMLLPDHEAEQAAPAHPLTRAEAQALRALLRGVVTHGSGIGLADVPGPPVLAKTGTAEFGTGDDPQTHAWMIAARGDLAVAVFVEVGESGSRTAGPLIETFLRSSQR